MKYHSMIPELTISDIEITKDFYRASRSAAFHPKAARGHFGNPALASR